MIYSDDNMAKKNSHVWKVCFLMATLLFVALPFLYAQEKDFTTWASAGFKYKIKPDFVLSGKLEWRTKDNLDKTDRWGVDVGGKYTLFPFLNLGAGYEVHYRNRGDAGWKFRHRYHLDGTLSTRVLGFKLSLRERFQHTMEGSKDDLHLRSRFQLGYGIPKWDIEPYVSVEMYNSLSRGDHFDVSRMRYRGGVVLPLSPRWEADVFYCRQWEKEIIKNIVGVACTYSF